MQKVIVDCTPQRDAVGRTIAATETWTDLIPAEQAAYDALQALPRAVPTVSTVAGRVTLSLLDGVTKAVVLSKTMRSSDYVVMLNPSSGALAVSLWTTSHTTSGFTLNLSAAISGTLEYIAQDVT